MGLEMVNCGTGDGQLGLKMVNWDWRWLTVGPEMVNCGTGDG